MAPPKSTFWSTWLSAPSLTVTVPVALPPSRVDAASPTPVSVKENFGLVPKPEPVTVFLTMLASAVPEPSRSSGSTGPEGSSSPEPEPYLFTNASPPARTLALSVPPSETTLTATVREPVS